MFRQRLAASLALLTFLSSGLAGAAGLELISRRPPRFAPDTTGGVTFVERPAISADGRYIAFVSAAPNLAPGQIDRNPGPDVFLHDRVAGTTRLVSHAAGSPDRTGDRGSEQAALSTDGRFVAFASAARDLVPGVGEAGPDLRNLYLWDRETGGIALVSRRAGGAGGDGSSSSPALSADGEVVVFVSRSTGLVPGVTLAHPGPHVYLYERSSGAVTLVSRSAASPGRSGDQPSSAAAVSADGRFVAYLSGATDLVAGQNDANGAAPDVFLFDRLTGATVLASRAAGSAVTTADGRSFAPSLSADGRYTVFASLGADLVPGAADSNQKSDVFLFDRLLGTAALVSGSGAGAEGGVEPGISADGSTAVYFVDNPNQPRGAQIVAYDTATASRSLVTRAPDSPFTFANRGATSLSLSADGRIVAFTSSATNLVAGAPVETPREIHLFVHDRTAGTTALASHVAGSPLRAGDLLSFVPSLSADGRWLAYLSLATDLVAGVRDTPPSHTDLFLYERATGANRVLTVHPPGLASVTGAGYTQEPSVSADGRYVAFVTYGASPLPGVTVPPGRANVYFHDRVTRQTVLVSRSIHSSSAGGDSHSQAPRVSRDGSVVAFSSLAGDLVPGQEDHAGTYDVFLWDRRTGRTALVSHAHGSRARAGTNSVLGGVSADGSLVAFNSPAGDLAPGQRDANGVNDVFVWDRRTGAVSLVSHRNRQPARAGNEGSLFSSMSPDGAFIAFESAASDLTGRDVDARTDAFLYERRTGRITLLGRAGGASGGHQPLVGANGRWVAFAADDGREEDPGQEIVLLDRGRGDALAIAPPTPGPLLLAGLSDDGRWLLFTSTAPDLVPGQVDDDLTADLFLFDRVTREIRLVSHVPGDPLRTSGSHVVHARLSPDGRWVAFQSDSPLLLSAPGPDPVTDVFLYDRQTGETVLASRSAFDPGRGGNGGSSGQEVVDGGLVVFASQASNLVPRDFNLLEGDVFVFVPGTP